MRLKEMARVNKEKTIELFFILLLFICLSFSQGKVNSSTSGNYKRDATFSRNCIKDYKGFKVIAVCDGDTIVIGPLSCNLRSAEKINLCSHDIDLKKISCLGYQAAGLYKVRFLGIDSFEMKQNEYGKQAKDFLTKLVLNKRVCVETDVEEKDKYDRTLGYVFVRSIDQWGKKSIGKSKLPNRPTDLVLANEELVKNGLAIVYSFPPNTRYLSKLKKAQIFARQSMIGIWKEGNYIKETPGQWRKRTKN